MNLSPEDRQTVLATVAENLTRQIRAEIDLPDLITLPAAVVCQITGLSRSQVERTFTLRSMGKRRAGVSLRDLQTYQKTP
jgi:hypothetical protein